MAEIIKSTKALTVNPLGVPYQTLIASVLHKYVTGCLTEPSAPPKQK